MTVYCGVDFHARQQTVAWCDTSDGEIHLEKLDHQDHNQVRSFYARWGRGAIVGLEASGYSQWFEGLLASLGHQSWVGETCEIRRRARSRQKNDRRDAELILDLLLKDEFPRVHRLTEESLEVLRRLWRPPPAGQDAHPGEQRALRHRPRTRAPRARRNCSREAGASGSRRSP